MKVKRLGKVLLVWLCIATLLLPFCSEVIAAALTSESETTTLETVTMRQGGSESSGAVTSSTYDESSYSYKVNGNNVLKIVQTGDSTFADMIYCINGMGSFPESSTHTYTYTNQGDFTDETNSAVEEWKDKVGITDENYEKLINVLNILYLMKQDTSYKATYINNAFSGTFDDTVTPAVDAQFVMTYLTDDDIDVIQQWAIWYFTNGTTDSDNDYYNSVFASFGSVTLTSPTGTADLQSDSATRYSYMQTLYNYLINVASETDTTSSSVTYPTIESTTVTSEVDGDYYKVGPFKINSGDYTSSDITVTLTFKTSDGTTVSLTQGTDYYIYVDGSVTSTSYSKILDKEYYIYIPKDGNTVTNVSLSMSYETQGEREITIWTGEDTTSDEDLAAATTAQEQERYTDLQEVILLTEEDGKEVSDSISGTITIEEEPEYDLALRKFVVSINGDATTGRTPTVTKSSLQALADGTSDTAEYTHAKDALSVKTGDTIVYEFRIYNEGETNAKVGTVVDYIPEGLTVVDSSSSTINSKYGWTTGETTNGFTAITSDYLSDTTIPAFNTDTLTLSYVVLQVECEITGDLSSGTVLTNVAEILSDNGDDRDSTEGSIDPDTLTDSFSGNTSNDSDLSDSDTYYKGLQDDDDFEKVVIEGDLFDLSLKKFISKVNDTEYDREPTVDVTPLNNGENDATYTTDKSAVTVQTGDIVTFTIRVYNEGDIAGYADEITDYIPEGLGFLVNYQGNYDNYWQIDDSATSVKLSTITNGTDNLTESDFYDDGDLEDEPVVLGGAKVTSTALSYSSTSTSNLIKAFDGETLSYKDVEITCIVTAEDEVTLKNIAAITGEKDEDGEDVDTDRDSTSVDSTPDDDIDPDTYTTGNEDDDDYDVVKTSEENFDLALQKFITALNDDEITTRVPSVSVDSDGNISYSHTSESLSVGNGDYITYTIRVYNEGNVAGTASEITDDIPTGLVFVEDNEINEKYGWEMLDSSGSVTTDSSQAVAVRTSYLEDRIIKAFDGEVLSYADVKIVFQIDESAISKTTTTSVRTITNTAEITEAIDEDGNPVDDIDSTPNNNNLDEDDIDQENVYVKYFDLSLVKDLYSAEVTVDGDSKTYYVGDDEDSIKVEVYRKNISSTTIKFTYNITVTNEGEIAGYATEITDYIPTGLYFDSSDNADWVDNGDGSISTDALAETLLEPGESATVKVVLRWTQSETNTGKFVNIAEISEDWNEYDSDDVDSTPNNKVVTEDDYDTAPVYVSISTGLTGQPYILLTTVVLVILGTGITLIKKYVL